MEKIDFDRVLEMLDHEIILASHGSFEPRKAKDLSFNPSTLDFRVRTVLNGHESTVHFKNANDAIDEYNGF